MRRGRLALLVLVLLLAFPSAAAAEPAPLPTGQPKAAEVIGESDAALQERFAVAARELVVVKAAQGRPKVVAFAMRFLGTPYRWAGASPSGFDCSGFVMYVYAHVGISLPHSSWMQYQRGRFVPRDRLRPGDLVFFNGLGHAGIYIGHGRFIHSPHTGDVVKISRLSEGWYRSTYYGARRL
jgi:cell wall-associated NlpC family hydrolase